MASTREESGVIDNESASRFETHVEGRVAILKYTRREGLVTYVHTAVPKELEGKGIAGMLAKHPGALNTSITNPRLVKLLWLTCLAGGVMGVVTMWMVNIPLPRVR